MKKIFLGLSVVFASLFSAQYYPNNGWGDDSYNNGYYGDRDDSYYFPDDYYYEYPDDYYSDDYYRSYYNDYRRSISMINWQRFFMQYQLTRMQIDMILDLNRQFDSYYVWNNYYRMNPNRWYYDRFYALERILGPRIFIVFQNNYYDGYSPYSYYTNRWQTYYRPRYHIRPAYVNININHYRVNRTDYHRSVGSNYGWNQPRSSRTPGGFKEDNRSNGSYQSARSNSGYRNQNNTGFRNQNSTGARNGSDSSVRTATPRSGGFRTDSNSNGVRNASPRTENRSMRTVPQRSSGSTMSTRSEAQRMRSTESSSSNRSANSGGFRSSGSRSGGNSDSGSRGSGGSLGGRR